LPVKPSKRITSLFLSKPIHGFPFTVTLLIGAAWGWRNRSTTLCGALRGNFGDDGLGLLPDDFTIEIGPAGLRVEHVVFAVGCGRTGAIGPEYTGFATGGAQIHAGQTHIVLSS
jgi:hypothetical protein